MYLGEMITKDTTHRKDEINMEKQRRVMLKLSGEALAGEKKTGFDEEVVKDVARQVKLSVDQGVQVAIVIGGGNFWRGRSSNAIDRPKADQIGMLATVMNCIYVSEIFRTTGMKTEIFTPFACSTFTKLFSKDAANEALAQGKVVSLQAVPDIHIFLLTLVLYCVLLRWRQTLSFLQRQSTVFMTVIRQRIQMLSSMIP